MSPQVHTFESPNLAKYGEVRLGEYRVIVWRDQGPSMQPAVSVYGPRGFIRSTPVPDRDFKKGMDLAQRVVIRAQKEAWQ